MATKEDILEQIVEEYLIHSGYFVRHNIKFLPSRDHPDFVSNQDSNHSDIDVLAIHPHLSGAQRVVAVSCKSWQSGFDPISELAAIRGEKTRRGREAWRGFRELLSPKWSQGFRDAVLHATGSSEFTYIMAVAKLKGDASAWEQAPEFASAMAGNPIRVLTFKQMIESIAPGLTTTVASTEVGRLLQIFKTAGYKMA